MDLETYKQFLINKAESNFEKLEPYFEIETNLFFGVGQLMNEFFRCLILDAHVAGITIGNHILERLLKIVLIYNNSLNNKNEQDSIKAYNKYQGMALRSTITNCFNQRLINLDEKAHLEKFINDLLRNGFSHSSFENVLKSVPFKIPALMGNIYNDEIKNVEIDRRHLISISELQMEQFARENSFEYYKYLHNLIKDFSSKIKLRET
ncbi:hypothetical protein [Flavobacterium sp. 5]|uniref:hypothetical protein n=1 Tax=Flavobacterium sp. 5 TaxID=2035199 RepID=UPI000C2C8DA3|nr:hypothetical protein [Flavobacterium sp. 5]PKB17906.1 hypothetical protein CLU82_3156 [Flavobacterium sp. 5]